MIYLYRTNRLPEFEDKLKRNSETYVLVRSELCENLDKEIGQSVNSINNVSQEVRTSRL